MTPRIEAREVCVRFGSRRALERASFSLERGRIAVVLGENGSGKTTLLKTLARIRDPVEGGVLYDGRALESYSRRGYARRVAYLPQTIEIVFPISALEVVLQGRVPHRLAWQLESERDRKLALQAMEACDVAPLASRDAATLSGGERRRVFLARALAQEAETWLLDEPTGDLDPRHRLEFWELLARAHREWKPTVVLVTHDLERACSLADDLLLLAEGRVVAFGDKRDVLTRDNLRWTFHVEAEIGVGANGALSVGKLALS